MPVNHQHLRAFHAVATERSFSRAARRLNLSQPTLSQHIKSLEGRYGQALFESRHRPLNLTPIGQELLLLTQRMFSTSEEIGNLLMDQRGRAEFSIRLVSDSPVYAVRLTQALLRANSRREIAVQIENSANSLAHLRDARADVAIISHPQIDARLAYKPLFVDFLKVALPANHHLASAEKFPLAALERETLLIREPTSTTRRAVDSLLSTERLEPAHCLEVHSREAIREAVAIGMGISLFFSAECPPDPRIVYRTLDCQPDATLLTGYVVCSAERRRSAVMRAVLLAAATLEPLSPVPLASPSAQQVSAPKAGLAAV